MSLTAKIGLVTVAMFAIYLGCETAREGITSSDKTLTVHPESSEEIPANVVVDVQPKIVGGLEAIQKNIVYPKLAKLAGIEGFVSVALLIGEDGSVLETRIAESSGSSMLDNAAVEAMKSVRYIPAKLHNKPVEFWLRIPVRFKL